MEFSIRDMLPEDMDGKAYVHWKAWHETYTGLIDQDFLDNRTLEQCMDKARRFPDRMLIAEANGKIVGFARYGEYQYDKLADHGEIQALYVLKEYHHQKIGYALMNACMDRLNDYPRVAVWVLRGNETAIRFYERYGFRFDGASMEVMLGTPNTELRMIYRR